MLCVSPAAVEAMKTHAAAGYPLEICGLLIGTGAGEDRTVVEAWPVQNAWEEDPSLREQILAGLHGIETTASAADWEAHDAARRFVISPRDVMLAMKRARASGWDIVGVYHTHPNHPAIPSEYDRSVAQPEWSYVILSVRDGTVAEVRSWALNAQSRFGEEAIAVTRAGQPKNTG